MILLHNNNLPHIAEPNIAQLETFTSEFLPLSKLEGTALLDYLLSYWTGYDLIRQ